jgi:hypothetical protein
VLSDVDVKFVSLNIAQRSTTRHINANSTHGKYKTHV